MVFCGIRTHARFQEHVPVVPSCSPGRSASGRPCSATSCRSPRRSCRPALSPPLKPLSEFRRLRVGQPDKLLSRWQPCVAVWFGAVPVQVHRAEAVPVEGRVDGQVTVVVLEPRRRCRSPRPTPSARSPAPPPPPAAAAGTSAASASRLEGQEIRSPQFLLTSIRSRNRRPPALAPATPSAVAWPHLPCLSKVVRRAFAVGRRFGSASSCNRRSPCSRKSRISRTIPPVVHIRREGLRGNGEKRAFPVFAATAGIHCRTRLGNGRGETLSKPPRTGGTTLCSREWERR